MTACADCNLPNAAPVFAGWRRLGDVWLPTTRPLCPPCGARDVQERAEKAAS